LKKVSKRFGEGKKMITFAAASGKRGDTKREKVL
jgi:hypothetical protein